ncbi:lamin tail domain-containing protein [Halomicroarcula sp. F24A]|uniref:Lamin tail domain-containing protein n=2 Tax=Haloarcula salinisoli TaxID=2487746 RepID=A0A8J7YMX3_9EURY|nr:lamin tail domain-containing protein [Halomicroarcula salinisoli]
MFRSRPLLLMVCCSLVVLVGCAGVIQPDGSAANTNSTTITEWNSSLEVHYINVGQSVSTLVVSPSNETMLIDTGHYNDDGEYVLQYLQSHNITRIDHLVVSHNDADHIGGNAAIIDYYETEADGIGAIYDPGIAASTQTYEGYLDEVEEHDVTLYETREGDSIQFEGVDVQVLGPPDPYLESEARNENSIVLRLSYGETSFLLTGDAEDDQEAYLVEEYGTQLNATVLKAGHHGSSSSTSEALLDAVDPQAVVVSSAYDSQYGHPTEDVLDRLATRSIPTYWTATHGDIVFVSNGTAVSVQTQQGAPTDPSTLRDGEPIEPGTGDEVVERDRIGAASGTVTEPVATDGGGGELVVADINADAEGDDRENLNGEFVVFRNDGDAMLDLSGWTVADEAGKTYEFPDGYTLAAGDSVTLYTGNGTDTETELYWGYGSPVWNNGGDTVIVRNSEGDTILEETY